MTRIGQHQIDHQLRDLNRSPQEVPHHPPYQGGTVVPGAGGDAEYHSEYQEGLEGAEEEEGCQGGGEGGQEEAGGGEEGLALGEPVVEAAFGVLVVL